MSSALTATRVPAGMTVQEFCDWASLAQGRWELVDGEPRAMTPPLRTHGAIAAELAGYLAALFRQQAGPCSVVIDAGIVPAMLSSRNMRVADLAVTCTPYESEERAITDPVLIVEILSPSNQADTWSNVWAYTTIPSVREILILRGDMIGADLLRRAPDGAWPDQPEPIEGGDLVLASVGLRVALAALYRTTRLARLPA